MVVFNGNFDLTKFQECLQYVQDSLDWLVASEEKDHLWQVAIPFQAQCATCFEADSIPLVSKTSVFPPEALDQTAATLNALLQRRVYHLHNMRLRVNRLPTEIFGHILSYLADHPLPFPLTSPTGERGVLPMSMGLWHRASGVCRHWRQEVLNTLGLWTMIKVSGDATRDWAATWFSRSGVLPLTLYFDVSPEDEHRTFREDIPWILAAKRRINTLCFYLPVALESITPLLVTLADQLETLLVDSPSFWSTALGHPYELPRLRILAVSEGNLWRSWSMHELQHLCLTSQWWEADDVRGLLAVLETNPRLEELMLYEVYVTASQIVNFQALVEEPGSPIRLSKLERLFIHQVNRAAFGTSILFSSNKLSIPSTCTHYYILIESSFEHAVDHARIHAITAKHLALSSEFLVGTDGISTWIVERDPEAPQHMEYFDLVQVQELWLRTPLLTVHEGVFDLSTGPEITAIRNMPNIVKLVIVRNVSHWFTQLVNSFPALKELHILVQFEDDRQPILDFLTQRKQAGKQVDTLHFVGDPTTDDSEAFNTWKEDPSEFRQHITNEVVFEETRLLLESTYEEHVSARLGLPDVCKRSSPVNLVWRPWFTFATLDSVV